MEARRDKPPSLGPIQGPPWFKCMTPFYSRAPSAAAPLLPFVQEETRPGRGTLPLVEWGSGVGEKAAHKLFAHLPFGGGAGPPDELGQG